MNESNYKRRLEEVKKFLDANDAKLITHSEAYRRYWRMCGGLTANG